MFVVLWFAMSRGDNRGLAVGMGLFSIIFGTLGSIFLANGLPNLWRSYLSTGWPQTKGVIVHRLYGKHLCTAMRLADTPTPTRHGSDRRTMTMQHSSLYPPGGEVTVTTPRQSFDCDGRDGNREGDLLDFRRRRSVSPVGWRASLLGLPC